MAMGIDDELFVGNSSLKLTFSKYEVKTIVYQNGLLKEIKDMLI